MSLEKFEMYFLETKWQRQAEFYSDVCIYTAEHC